VAAHVIWSKSWLSAKALSAVERHLHRSFFRWVLAKDPRYGSQARCSATRFRSVAMAVFRAADKPAGCRHLVYGEVSSNFSVLPVLGRRRSGISTAEGRHF
jgi:hypothetical protein